MRDADNGTGILLQMLLQPVDRLGVQVVGRLIQQQYVRLLEQQSAKGHPTTLASGQRIHHLILRRTTQSVHGTFQTAVEVPCVRSVDLVLQLRLTVDQGIHLIRIFQHLRIAESLVHLLIFFQGVHDLLHAFLHDLLHGLARLQLRVLLQIPYGIPGGEDHLSLIILIDTGDNLQQRRFTGTIQSNDSDFRPIEKGQIYIL